MHIGVWKWCPSAREEWRKENVGKVSYFKFFIDTSFIFHKFMQEITRLIHRIMNKVVGGLAWPCSSVAADLEHAWNNCQYLSCSPLKVCSESRYCRASSLGHCLLSKDTQRCYSIIYCCRFAIAFIN